jgi:hypothetical protein
MLSDKHTGLHSGLSYKVYATGSRMNLAHDLVKY